MPLYDSSNNGWRLLKKLCKLDSNIYVKSEIQHLLNMLRFILLSTICFISAATSAFACQCEYHGPFIKMAHHTPLVALIKVSKYLSFKELQFSNGPAKSPMSMEIEIIEIYIGKETRKSVVVWGDPGNLCRAYLSQFKEEHYYVMALNTGTPGFSHKDEKKSDYSITNCGEYWLTVDFHKSTASGDIDSKNASSRTTSLAELSSMLAKSQPVNVLSLKDQEHFSEMNTFSSGKHITLTQEVNFNIPRALDEEYWITLNLTIFDTAKAKQLQWFYLRDTSAIKSVFGWRSAWLWQDRETSISGRVRIISWTKDSIEVEFDIEVFEYNFRRSYIYDKKRTFLKAKKSIS